MYLVEIEVFPVPASTRRRPTSDPFRELRDFDFAKVVRRAIGGRQELRRIEIKSRFSWETLQIETPRVNSGESIFGGGKLTKFQDFYIFD